MDSSASLSYHTDDPRECVNLCTLEKASLLLMTGDIFMQKDYYGFHVYTAAAHWQPCQILMHCILHNGN